MRRRFGGRSNTLSVAAGALVTGPATLHAGLISEVALIVIGFTVLVVAGLTLYWLSRQQAFYTWFMLHLAIGTLGIMAVLILAVEGTLDAAASAILSSIVAYSLGASGARGLQQSQADSGQPVTPPVVVSLPHGQVNAAYRADTVRVPGQAQPYGLGWAAAPGSSLPPGLQFDGGTGVVSGTPTQAGTFTFTVRRPAGPGGSMLGEFELVIAAAGS